MKQHITIDSDIEQSVKELHKIYKYPKMEIFEDYVHHYIYFDRTENYKADTRTEKEYEDYLRIRTLKHIEDMYKRKVGI